MTKMMISAFTLLLLALLLLAAVPQEQAKGRTATTYGDRCAQWIGRRFTALQPRGTMRMKDDGHYELVAVGVDFAEFEGDTIRHFIPLEQLMVIGTK